MLLEERIPASVETGMGTYYPTSSPQIDVLSSPYVRDTKFASYSESPILNGNMMMYLNPAASAVQYPEMSSGTSISAQDCVDIASISGRNEVVFIPPNGGPMALRAMNEQFNGARTETVGSPVTGELPLSSSRQLEMVEREQNFQGLSLSLSTQMSTAIPNSQFQYPYGNPGLTSLLSSHLPLQAENECGQVTGGVDESPQSKDLRSAGYVSYDIHTDGENSIRFGTPNDLQYPAKPKIMNSNLYQYEQAGAANAILKSKYLKAVQHLLDEVVNVGEALKQADSGKDQNSNKAKDGSKDPKGKSVPASDAEESATSSSHELSAAERQELQNKLDKLMAMLDEVDRRYKQYYHQMQILVSSFDMVAGHGAAKPYTALALKTISRHFRCLHDAISNQIQATRKSLGEQDPANGQGGSIPRLRYIDHQLRQQRALQQFGMMRHAWRPQRGLPETAVSVLRAWLFEHFLHPYPKDSEKIMLARQTGLTRGQVANWFINARVRLWKPMVEEMYKEEFGEGDINFKSSPENTPKGAPEKSWASEDKREDQSETSMATTDHQPSQRHDSRLNTNHGGVMSGTTERQLQFNPQGDDAKNYEFMRLPDDHYNGEGSLMMAAAAGYQVSELGSFTVDNQVSLALGLHNGKPDATVGSATTEYLYIDPVNQQHRFGNIHLLNDFVAH